MLKLMKYEFRKTRTVLLILLAAFAALQAAFALGLALDKDWVVATCVVLDVFLVYGAFAYILISAIVSYSRELKDRTGYLTFMMPVGPWSVVLSKLCFALLAALAATAVFGLGAWLDIRELMRRAGVERSMLDQANMVFEMFVSDAPMNLTQLLHFIAYVALTVLISTARTICTAFLAITVSATIMQNRKGFLRGLVTVLAFIALSVAASIAVDQAAKLAGEGYGDEVLTASLWITLGLNLAFSALFAGLSALLLDRKVSL